MDLGLKRRVDTISEGRVVRVYPEPHEVSLVVAAGGFLRPFDGTWWVSDLSDPKIRWLRQPIFWRRFITGGGGPGALAKAGASPSELRVLLHVHGGDRVAAEAMGAAWDPVRKCCVVPAEQVARFRSFLTATMARRYGERQREEERRRRRLVESYRTLDRDQDGREVL